MSRLQRFALIAVAALLAGSRALAADDAPAWRYSAAVSAYILPGPDYYGQPTVTTDHQRLHLEARYNYEARGAASVWGGYNFSVGETVTFEGTAMLGGVFGSTTGVAPGYKATLGWTKLAFYSEGEYVFDTSESSDSFFYAWTELSWAPVSWCRFGLVGQRTRVYQTDRDIQRGFLLGFSGEHVGYTTYVFNPDERSPTVVMTLSLSF